MVDCDIVDVVREYVGEYRKDYYEYGLSSMELLELHCTSVGWINRSEVRHVRMVYTLIMLTVIEGARHSSYCAPVLLSHFTK